MENKARSPSSHSSTEDKRKHTIDLFFPVLIWQVINAVTVIIYIYIYNMLIPILIRQAINAVITCIYIYIYSNCLAKLLKHEYLKRIWPVKLL